MAENKNLRVTENSDAGVRRFDSTPIRLCCVALLCIFGWYALNRTPLADHITFAKTYGRPQVLLPGAAQATNQLFVELQNSVAVQPAEQESSLRTIRIQVPKNTISNMFAALQYGDPELGHEEGGNKPYFKATIQDNNADVQRCKICLRGTMPWHHQPAKPSLRIRIKKEDLNGGPRFLELTRPEDSLAMKNWLPSSIADELGLLHEHNEHIRVFLNEKFLGVYLCSMRQTELMALNAKRMPGTFFKGEFGGDLWASLESWKLSGDESPADLEAFEDFLAILREEPSPESFAKLRTVFDVRRYAQWTALMIVTGSIHTDRNHNHSYFFCPNLGKLEAIPWDCNSFGIHTQVDTTPDTALHPLQIFLSQDPEWIQLRNTWVWKLLQDIASPSNLQHRVEAQYASMAAELKADGYLREVVFSHAEWISKPVSVRELVAKKSALKDWICARADFLSNYLEDCRYIVQASSSSTSCRITVSGNVALKVAEIGTDANREWLLAPALASEAVMGTSRPYQGILPAPYLPRIARTFEIPVALNCLIFSNAVTGTEAKQEAGPLDLDAQLAQAILLPTTQQIEEIMLGPGPVALNEDLIVRADQCLVIRPGTQLLLAPNVGIYSEGQVLALGSEEKPIRIQSQANEIDESVGEDYTPWSTFAVFGTASGDSHFSHCNINGGSTGEFHHRRFKGMFSIYNCPRVTITNCTFGENFIGDDAVNIAQSEFAIRSCTWKNAKADALDCDMARGTIEDSHWVDAGNDAIDLMTCKVFVTNCEIKGSGDKGISIGEDSKLVARTVSIDSCLIGTEAKDDSTACFTDCEFTNNNTGAHSYQKKWFYHRAGSLHFKDCRFAGSKLVDIHAEKRAKFKLDGTTVASFAGAASRFQLDQTKAPRKTEATPSSAEIPVSKQDLPAGSTVQNKELL
ncbi:MAG: CotH kinase family protein [Planctomycetota bacterium]